MVVGSLEVTTPNQFRQLSSGEAILHSLRFIPNQMRQRLVLLQELR